MEGDEDAETTKADGSTDTELATEPVDGITLDTEDDPDLNTVVDPGEPLETIVLEEVEAILEEKDAEEPERVKTIVELADEDAIYPKDWPLSRQDLRNVWGSIIYIAGKYNFSHLNDPIL